MVLPAVLRNGKKKLPVNVMLDPCSTETYITESATEELQLKGQTQNLTISEPEVQNLRKRSKRVQCLVASVNGLFSTPVEANVLDNITGNTPAVEWDSLKKDWPHLSSVPFDKVANRRQIDLLVGIKVFHKVLREVTGERSKDPIARQKPLGWVCFGPTSENLSTRSYHAHTTRIFGTGQTVNETNDLLRKFWELEAIGIKEEDVCPMTQDKAKAIKTAQLTQIRKDGRYEIGIP